jgi:redox-sensitive bicupin YhaK (pirin superfamily)
MIAIRNGHERGRTQIDWLDSQHSFSFGDYRDPKQMGFRSLRVINDDRVAPAGGFGMHGHRDMEIVSYVLSGTLAHRDSLGTGSEMKRGDVQRMSAGSGIRHSEFNGSNVEPVHFLQIWILPERNGLPPEYEQRNFSDDAKRDQLRLIASHDGRAHSLTIHQDVNIFASLIGEGHKLSYEICPNRHAWIQVAQGRLTVNGHTLEAGDGAAISDETLVEVMAIVDAEFLLFDLA